MLIVGLCLTLGPGGPTVRSRLLADEPYQIFLERLRDERLFDLALVYLQELESRPGVDKELRSALDLERGLLKYQAAALLPASNPERADKLNAAEADLRNFLKSQTQHPRRGEARLKLGELLLTRAEEAKAAAGEEPADIPEAIRFYTAAHVLFEDTIQELAGILEKLKGNRVDPSNKRMIALRERVQQDLRQAQLLSAKSVEDRGRARAVSSPERAKDLKQALRLFSELYSKERRMVGIRNYALFYRCGLNEELGSPDDAIDGYQRIADLEGVDVLRPLQTNALTRLITLLADQEKFPVAIDRADSWLRQLKPAEEKLPDTFAFKLAQNRVRLQWAEALQESSPKDRTANRLIRDARSDLRQMLRTPGPHVAQAQALLAELGIENQESRETDLPVVKEFGEALDAANERLNRAETEAIGAEALQQELSSPQTPDARKAELQEQYDIAQEAIDTDQRQAMQLYRSSLAMFTKEDGRSELFDARFKLGFIHLKQQQPWEAIAIGQFLSRKNPGSDQGLRAAALALGGFAELLRSAGQDSQKTTTEALEPLARYLLETWPESEEATAATSVLVQLAIVDRDYPKAAELLARVPAGSPGAATARRDLGLAIYSGYLEAKKQGEAAESLTETRNEAIKNLSAFSVQLNPGQLDERAVQALNALCRLQVDAGDGEAASSSIAKAITLLDSEPGAIPVRTAMNSYRLAILATSAQMAAGGLKASEAASTMQSHIATLQELADGDPEGEATLMGMLVGIARDLQEQLSLTKKGQARRNLSAVLMVVAAEAAKSDSFNTSYWAADTVLSIAEELSDDPSSAEIAAAAYKKSADSLEAMLSREESQPGWVQPPTLKTQLNLLLAKCRRGMMDYPAAIQELAAILKQSPNLLDVQIESARTLEAWARTKPVYYKTAYAGGPGRKKLFWGWGRIAQETLGKEQFEEQFFEARYHLALCRFRNALNANDNDEMLRAQQDITRTAGLFPKLGGPAQEKKFDALARQIEKELAK